MPTNSPKAYTFSLLLIASILLGGLFGFFFKEYTPYLKPFGDIFLHLMFTMIVPLIFFSVSSAITRADRLGTIKTIFLAMVLVFVFTSAIAAIYALLIVKIFPPAEAVYLQLGQPQRLASVSLASQLVDLFTVSDFSKLFSHQRMLALIVFALLLGFAVNSIKEKGKHFAIFLQEGEAVFMRVFSLIMYYAPIGFFAYFAVLVSEIGLNLLQTYARVALIYYVFSLVYFFVAYTIYAYFAGKKEGVKVFWQGVFLPLITAVATCSSAASIPASLMAAKKMRVSPEIYETVIPLGAMIHKDGSVIGGMCKIAFLFGIFHLDFTGLSILLSALAVSFLVGTVMGAIPSGGLFGELLILNLFGFPPSVLMVIAAISIIIDPLATLLNVTGNSVSAMMIARLVEGKHWLFFAKTNDTDSSHDGK